MRYLDTSALAKLVLPERESASLEATFSGEVTGVTSALTRTELARAVLRRGGGGQKRLAEIVGLMTFIPVADALLDAAGRLRPPTLRSLDAIHLASALMLRDELEAFVAYDDRLLDAASALGLPVASPGR